MPNRYTTYLNATPSGEGTFRISFGHMLDLQGGGKLLGFVGPAPVLPPDREFTAAELDKWQFDMVCETGYSIPGERAFNTKQPFPIIEVMKTIEETIPKGSVAAAFEWVQHPRSGEQTFAVTVTNKWNEIPAFTLAVGFEYEAHQPHPTAPPEWGVEAIGGSDSCFEMVGPPIGLDSLMFSIPATFVFDPAFLPDARSRAVAMSTESQWISLRTNGYEFDRIDGKVLAEFLETEST
jgi:hypothetical protein